MYGVKLDFTFSARDVLIYTGYLLDNRKVAGATVEKYLSGIRYIVMVHMINVPQ